MWHCFCDVFHRWAGLVWYYCPPPPSPHLLGGLKNIYIYIFFFILSAMFSPFLYHSPSRIPLCNNYLKMCILVEAVSKCFHCIWSIEDVVESLSSWLPLLLPILLTADSEEHFLVLPKELAEKSEQLTLYKQLLMSTKPLTFRLDRNLRVFRLSSRVAQFDLPNDFFHLTVDEIRKEQKQRLLFFFTLMWSLFFCKKDLFLLFVCNV